MCKRHEFVNIGVFKFNICELTLTILSQVYIYFFIQVLKRVSIKVLPAFYYAGSNRPAVKL